MLDQTAEFLDRFFIFRSKLDQIVLPHTRIVVDDELSVSLVLKGSEYLVIRNFGIFCDCTDLTLGGVIRSVTRTDQPLQAEIEVVAIRSQDVNCPPVRVCISRIVGLNPAIDP